MFLILHFLLGEGNRKVEDRDGIEDRDGGRGFTKRYFVCGDRKTLPYGDLCWISYTHVHFAALAVGLCYASEYGKVTADEPGAVSRVMCASRALTISSGECHVEGRI